MGEVGLGGNAAGAAAGAVDGTCSAGEAAVGSATDRRRDIEEGGGGAVLAGFSLGSAFRLGGGGRLADGGGTDDISDIFAKAHYEQKALFRLIYPDDGRCRHAMSKLAYTQSEFEGSCRGSASRLRPNYPAVVESAQVSNEVLRVPCATA